MKCTEVITLSRAHGRGLLREVNYKKKAITETNAIAITQKDICLACCILVLAIRLLVCICSNTASKTWSSVNHVILVM